MIIYNRKNYPNKKAHTKNHIGNSNSVRKWNTQYREDNGLKRRHQNETQIKAGVNTKLRAITSISPTSSATNPLKLTLIQTNGQSFVANSFNTHFYRWPIASQSPSTDYDIKWKTSNNPFASHFNPTIGSISTAIPPTIITTPMMPTADAHPMFKDHRMHTKHHTGLGYVKKSVFCFFEMLLFLHGSCLNIIHIHFNPRLMLSRVSKQIKLTFNVLVILKKLILVLKLDLMGYYRFFIFRPK